MGSPNEILAIKAVVQKIVFKQLQSVMLQILVVFDSDIKDVDFGEGKMQVGAYESKMDYSGVLEQLKSITEFNGVVESIQLNVSEKDGRGVEFAALRIKELAESYLSMTVSDVVVEVFVPSTAFRSLNMRLLVAKLDKDNKYNTEDLRGEDFSTVSFSDKRIRISAIHEMPMFDSAPAPAAPNPKQSQSQSADFPTDMDARVAAVLCEYTYFLCRNHEYTAKEAKKGTLSDKIGKIIPYYNFVKYLRESSIDTRKRDTQKEVEGLPIIPKRWKLIDSYEKGLSDSAKEELRKECKDSGIVKKDVAEALAKWDAVNLGHSNWVGMCEHETRWENSLACKIIQHLKNDKDRRFSLMGNKGFLNKWGFFCANSGLSSVLYVNETDYEVMYCATGSDFGKDMMVNGDWTTTNFLQFFIGLSPQYQQSVTNALILDRVITDIEKECGRSIKLTFIGHSLGGGLASNNAIVTSRRHAITFNAAGLHWFRVKTGLFLHNREELKNPLNGRERVHLFIMNGEFLDSLQSSIANMVLVCECLAPGGMLFAAKPELQAYSAPFTRKEIGESPSGIIDHVTHMFKKHSMVNFIDPPSQLDKLVI